MHRSSAVIAWILGCALTLAAPVRAAPAPVTAAKSRPHLTVVLDNNYPPYIFRAADGTVDGYLVDAWRLWQRKTGVSVNLLATDWAVAKATMAAGQADVIDTVFVTPEREKTMDFTAPYADLQVPIYVQRDIGGITGPASLRGFVVAAKAGDACIDKLQSDGVTSFREFASYAAIVDAAVADQVRIFCMDAPPANYLLYRAQANTRFRPAFVLYTGQFHRAVRKGDIATLQLVERGFAQFTPAENDQLRAKWFGAEIAYPAWLDTVVYALIGTAAFAMLILAWAFLLRRTVRARTVQLSNQQARLRTLLDTLPDLIWLKSLDGVYLFCNQQFTRLFNAPEAHIIGRTDADFVAPELVDAFMDSDRKTIAADCRMVNERWLHFAAGNYDGLFETVKTPVREADGNVVGVLGIARDVTSYRRAQDRLERLNRLYQVLTLATDIFASRRERQSLYQCTCDLLAGPGRIQIAWLGEFDADTARLRPVCAAGAGIDTIGEIDVSVAPDAARTPPAAIAWRENRIVVEREPALSADGQAWAGAMVQQGLASAAAFPICINGGAPCAVLSVFSGDTGFFDEEEVALLQRLSAQLGLTLGGIEADTERTKAQEELRASELRFSLMFRTSPIGMVLTNLRTGRIHDVNDAWLMLFGQERSTTLEQLESSVAAWNDPAQRCRLVDPLAEGHGVPPFDVRMHRHDGSALEVSVAGTRFEIAGTPYSLSSYVDVSARQQMATLLEQQAHQLEVRVALQTAELNGIFQALPDLYFRLDSAGTILDYRAGNSDSLFARPDEFLHKRMQDVLPTEIGASWQEALRRVSTTGSLVTFEYSLTSADSDTRFEARITPLREGQIVAVVRDISERAAYEQAREAALEETARLSRVRSDFIANMSHEVRTPLNGIMGMALLGQTDTRDESAREAFAHILRSCRQLLSVVNDVLDFSKIDANQLSIESVSYSPLEVGRMAADSVRPVALTKGLRLTVESDPDVPPTSLGDPGRLHQILLNLLANAVKFTSIGGVGLRIGRRGDQLVFRVQDTGIGIAPEQMAQLFQPFRQADASTTRQFGGTGLGLSIARSLARIMGGDISATSLPGQGSVFELTLQVYESGPVAHVVPADAGFTFRGDRLEGLAILVVEDNDVNQLVLQTILEREGASVVTVGSGQEAIAQVKAEGGTRFDVVLMDVEMPGMDGYSATREIHAVRAALPVIGQTAHAMASDRARCLAAGMVAHLTKPIDVGALVETVRAHTRKSDRVKTP